MLKHSSLAGNLINETKRRFFGVFFLINWNYFPHILLSNLMIELVIVSIIRINNFEDKSFTEKCLKHLKHLKYLFFFC